MYVWVPRCRQEFDHKDKAVKGDPTTRKSFHSFVLFLGELYLNLEVKILLPFSDFQHTKQGLLYFGPSNHGAAELL